MTAVRRRKGGCAVAALLLVLLLIGCAVLVLSSNAVKYEKAMQLLEAEEYEQAEILFEELSDYKQAEYYADLCAYNRAMQLLEAEAYEQARTLFERLSGFQKADYYTDLCTYNIAILRYNQQHYAEAAEMFAALGDFETSVRRYQLAVYKAGHACFVEGKYDEAWQWFDKMEDPYPRDTLRHFATLEDAITYLQQQEQQDTLQCYVANMPEECRDMNYLWDLTSNYLSQRSGVVAYDWEEKILYIHVYYYPSKAMLEAWRRNDMAALTEEEASVLEEAIALVEQAKKETDDLLETEIWLHDWLCENVVYLNPDMDVPTQEYLQLRELTCIGAIRDGKANCQGYTDAFYLLGTLAGLEVDKLSGEFREPHAWNSVCLNGEWYMVDVTFDDLEADDPLAKTYIFLNCAYDPDKYTVHGPEEFYRDLQTESDPELTYYGYYDCVFTDVEDAMLYQLRQRKSNGPCWTYAMITDANVDSDGVYEAVRKQLDRVGLRSVSWTEYIDYYEGNTYLTICWD